VSRGHSTPTPGGQLSVPTSGPADGRALAGGGLAVAVGSTVANVLAYGLSLAGARLLAPADYGLLVALLAVALVGSVPALALQAVVAVRVVRAGPAEESRVAGQTLGLGLAVAAAMVAVTAVAAPMLERFLRLPGPAAALWLAAALAPITLLGVLQGLTQGRQDFGRLAAVLVVGAAGRLVGGVAGLLVTRDATGAFAGVAAGTAAGAAVGWGLAGRPRPAGGWRPVRELVVASQALAGLYLLTNLDPVLARHYLPAAEAGLYGAGAVLAKAAFFLPQFVVLVVFPRLAAAPRAGRTLWVALAALGGLGLALTGAAWLAGGLTVTAVGGDAYRELAAHAWLFVANGATLVLVQLLLYAQLTAARLRGTAAVWGAVAVEAAVIATVAHGSLAAVVTAALGTALAAATLGVLWSTRAARSTRPPETPGAPAALGTQ
jgi:O-antigen/teichoic acid export membrane protein